MLESYGWPGNARELRNVIERMAILTSGERLTRESIPVEIRVQRESRAEIDHSGSAGIGRARAHSARAGGIELERLRRGTGAGYGAD